MQFRIHLGAALGHSGGHIDIVLMRHLDAQLGLPSLFGQLLCDIGLFLGHAGLSIRGCGSQLPGTIQCYGKQLSCIRISACAELHFVRDTTVKNPPQLMLKGIFHATGGA